MAIQRSMISVSKIRVFYLEDANPRVQWVAVHKAVITKTGGQEEQLGVRPMRTLHTQGILMKYIITYSSLVTQL